MSDDEPDGAELSQDDAVELPVTDELDLHSFRPAEVRDLVEDYLTEAHRIGFRSVRLIHGKGIGNLKRTVRALLDRHPLVESYRDAHEDHGSWGATIVELKR